MKRLSTHLGLARQMRISNVWLLESGSQRFLIDTGHPVERLALLAHLTVVGVKRPGDLTAVILTHRHSDHAGNAAWLRARFQCPVVCHIDEAPYLSGELEPPPIEKRGDPFWARWLCRVEDRFPAHTEIDEVIAHHEVRWGFRVFHSPGHTAGSILLHHEQTGTLFSGDAVIGGLPLRAIERLRLPMDYFSDDGERARSSMRALIDELPPTELLCSGHGPVIRRPMGKLSGLIERDVLRPTLRL